MKIRLEPNTFVLSFGKEYKHFSDLLVSAIDDYLANIDMENSGKSISEIKDLARIEYELKTAPLTGYTPRCYLMLYEVLSLREIVSEYGKKNNIHNASYLTIYLGSMYEKMKDVCWD